MIYVSRFEWNARKPRVALTSLPKVSNVFIHHSVTNPTKNPLADARSIQNFHIDSRKYADVAYTLMVHPDGTVLEGRTYSSGQPAVGAHTAGWNSKSVAICAIGNYEITKPSPALLAGINDALVLAYDRGWITSDARIRPHSDVGRTACCGKYLKEQLGGLSIRQAPSSTRGVPVTEFIVYNSSIILDREGNGYVDVRHDKGKDPAIAIAQANGNDPSSQGYPKTGNITFLTASFGGRFVRVTVVSGIPGAKFGIKTLLGW